jgi:hypothetical protein
LIEPRATKRRKANRKDAYRARIARHFSPLSDGHINPLAYRQPLGRGAPGWPFQRLFICRAPAHCDACGRGAVGPDGLAEEDFGRRLQNARGFVATNAGRRKEWMLEPEAKGVGQIEAERTLARVLWHRAWIDQWATYAPCVGVS